LRDPEAPPIQAVLGPPAVVARAAAATVETNDSPDHRPLWIRLQQRFGGDAASVGISALLHTLLLIVLAYPVVSDQTGKSVLGITVMPSSSSDELEPVESPSITADLPTDVEQTVFQPEVTSQLDRTDAPDIDSPFQLPEASVTITAPGDLARRMPLSSLLLPSRAPMGGGLGGRTPEQRARLAAERGGSAQSEDAVELGLAWLAAHQYEDGGWRLNHQEGPCASRCDNPGSVGTSTGATALALLPFLGAGYTHRQGKYQDVVERGLYYLTSRMLETRHGGDLQEGTMYAQGLATLALCEAYAMTDDQELKPYAQKALDFICNAQHPRGGWRYVPGAPGDTTVTGWQVMALKSGRMAGLFVPSHVIELVKEYLNSVQDAGGAFYGYQSSRKYPGPTAVGLLLRMYLGWTRDDERLARGALYLSATGPSKTDMYFNYYATLVLNHREGSEWERWNLQLREYLIGTQERSGHPAGSWFFADRHGSVGGRLYTTALCTMMLEVYYRYLPLYGGEAVEEEL